MNRNLIIFHRIDFDGLVSMSIIREKLEAIHGADSVDILGYTHGDDMPKISDQYTKVYVMDICLEPSEMLRLMTEGRLVWIDHHATTITDSERYGFDKAEGIRREGVGACELCFEWMYPNIKKPMLVTRLSAYDVWDKDRFDWEGETLPLQFGMRNRFNLDTKQVYSFYQNAKLHDIIEIIREGKTIINYVRTFGRKSCENYAFEVSVAEKTKGLCMLTTHFGAMEMEQTMNELGCTVAVCVNRNNKEGEYKVSVYAAANDPGFNIGEYMRKNYRGGGHRRAAGGVLTQKQFLTLMNEHML